MKTGSTHARRSGTQSIERVVLLLRELAARDQAGWGVRDLAQHCGLDPGTVHRMLKCLVAERLVRQRSADSRYFIGPLSFELGLSVSNRPALAESMQSAVRQLARQLPKTAAVGFLRSGDDCVCVGRSGYVTYTRAESSSRTGQRFPLLAKAAGMAIVAALSEAAAQEVVIRNRKRLAPSGRQFLARVDELLNASRQRGYTLSQGLFWHETNSIAMAFGPPGDPVGSVTVSAWSVDHRAESLRTLLPSLRSVTRTLSACA